MLILLPLGGPKNICSLIIGNMMQLTKANSFNPQFSDAISHSNGDFSNYVRDYLSTFPKMQIRDEDIRPNPRLKCLRDMMEEPQSDTPSGFLEHDYCQ